LVDRSEFRLKGCERNDNADHCAVRVADEETLFQLVMLPLVLDDVHVRQIDSRNDQRHKRVLAVVLRVGEDGKVSFEESHFCRDSSVISRLQCLWLTPHTDFSSNVAVQAREDKIAVLELFCGTFSNYQLSQLFRHGQ